MSCCPTPIHCILPPYVLDHLAESSDPKIRKLAVEAMATARSSFASPSRSTWSATS